jgi:hypothetical protein
LPNQVEDWIKSFSADGAYDKIKVYQTLPLKNINPLIPLCKGARKKHGNKKGRWIPGTGIKQ